MFDHMIAGYIERGRPVAFAAAARAERFMCEVVDELRAIRATTGDDDSTIYLRHGIQVANLPGGLAASVGGPQSSLPVWQGDGTIPPGEEWELEYYGFRSSTNSTIVIYRNGVLVFTYAATLAAQLPANGNGLRFQGGDVVTYEALGGAALTMSGYLQFRVKKPNPSRKVRTAAAYENPTPDGGTVPQVLRHEGTAFLGVNPVGEAKARQNGVL